MKALVYFREKQDAQVDDVAASIFVPGALFLMLKRCRVTFRNRRTIQHHFWWQACKNRRRTKFWPVHTKCVCKAGLFSSAKRTGQFMFHGWITDRSSFYWRKQLVFFNQILTCGILFKEVWQICFIFKPLDLCRSCIVRGIIYALWICRCLQLIFYLYTSGMECFSWQA